MLRFALILTSLVAFAQRPNTTPDLTFFNGQDLTGWQGNPGFWSVKDGAILGHSETNVAKNEFLWSNQIVGDFYLAVDVKLTPGNRNAGIQFRSKSVNDHGQAQGYQADVGAGVWGKLYHEHGRGKLDWNNNADGIIKDGDWNRYEILAVGDRIWTAINGKLCVALKDPEGERSGKIALQIHSGPPQTVAYRGLKLTHNPPVELLGMDEAQLRSHSDKSDSGPDWPALIAKHDPGSQGLAWSKPAFDDSTWKTMTLPGHFDAGVLPDFDGVVWFRKTLALSAEQVAKSATLVLGKIDDMDVTWVNGVRVGGYETPGHHYTLRKYTIPAGLLKAGPNHIAVRVLDHGWPGGIAGMPDQLYLQLGDERISLANQWRLAPGAHLATLTGKPAPKLAPPKLTHQQMSVSQPTADNSPAAELAALEIAEGYEVSLFADETDGIANPIAIRWDSRGRLWVLCSLVYPQIVPTEPPNDTLVILDGEKSTIFADGLDMPMGFALGDGGVYLGEGPDLVFLRDSDGDDKADSREVIFSGFGTGDTHQNINSFTWSPDGELLFCQGLHCFSRVETPWGIKRLDEHGVWRMRPRSRQLHAFRGGSGQNPWGISFGHWGEPFVKGNNNAVSEFLPIMIDTTHFQRPLDIGGTRIKSMICEIVHSPILPDDLQGDILIAGYFGHLIDRLDMSRDGSGHRGELQAPLIKTSHPSFRPVDIQTGPDGALYIADWYNPIIGHYQASLRHPNRDKTHGRIWRLAAEDSKPLPTTDLTKLRTPQLLERLRDTFLAERKRIRAELSNRDDVIPALKDWAKTDAEHFEALALHAWQESPNPELLGQALIAESAGLRAFATRLVGRWHDRIEQPMELLCKTTVDPDPRVRLEAIVALSYLPDVDAFPLACKVLDQPTDRFILAALSQAAHATKDQWFPTLPFANSAHLAFALKAVGGKDTAGPVRALLAKPDLPAESATRLKTLLAEIGNPQDLRWILERGAIPALVERKTRPAGELEPLIDLDDPIAIELAGIWKLRKLASAISAKVAPGNPAPVQRAAVLATVRLTGKIPDSNYPAAAIQGLCEIDLKEAAAYTVRLLRVQPDTTDVVVAPFLSFKDGPRALAEAADPEMRPAIRAVFAAAGHYEPALAETGLPTYSQDFVNTLAAEVKASGDAANGAQVYANPALACAACHKIGDEGGVLGPDLTAVGAGLPIEILIESVLWPRRQVKEGFLSTTLITKSGGQVAGYIESESSTQIRIRDAATGAIQTLAKSAIAHRADAGTLMPPGLTALLSRAELRDLIRFLSEQR